jgi:hypothetical protein
MTRVMIGSLILLAATLWQPAAPPVRDHGFRPAATASARATARIQVISGAKFGPDYSLVPASAQRRSARLIEADGRASSAELLEFQ